MSLTKVLANIKAITERKILNGWPQFLCMMCGQLTYRESVRDIINCLEAHKNKVYHLGLTKVVSPTTLTRAK